MTIRCYVFDIDGTLADCTHRLHHIRETPADWTSFYAGVSDDPPIPHVVAVAHALYEDGHDILFVTGRSDECRAATMEWLRKHVVDNESPDDDYGLYMRSSGDHREDAVVKMELLAKLRADGYEPVMVFEDRASMVSAWRESGIPCAQVASGDF